MTATYIADNLNLVPTINGAPKRGSFFVIKMNTITIITIFLLFATNLAQTIMWYKERAQMIDRLMAKSLPEYKDNIKPEENELEPKDDGTVELEDAKEDILNENAEE